MSPRDTFLQAIWHDPQHDRPRLDFADWLDQDCDPLGEFIRVQCRLEGAGRDPRGLEWETRQRELLGEFEDQWVGNLRCMVSWWTFRRGFVSEVGLSDEQLFRHGDALWQHAPITDLHLRPLPRSLEGLASSPILGRLRVLDLSSNSVRDEGVRLLVRSPHLHKLRVLNLSSAGLGNAAAEALAHAPNLGGLRELYLDNNRIGDAGAVALLNSPLAARLDVIHLRCNNISHAVAADLGRRRGCVVS